MIQVKCLDRSNVGRHIVQTVFHYETSKVALTKALELVNEHVPMRIVLILDAKGRVIFNQGFHTEGGLQ